ncbi:MAG: hypothetical protein CMP30_00955 [Roseibacillus sp.]|nr:hypothetical protein [Roseibacillus sp.]
MSKSRIIRDVCSLLENQLAIMQAAAAEARHNATGEETKSEGKYDTRAIEASYLAGAQSAQAEKIATAIGILQRFDPSPCQDGEPIRSGTLVEAEHGGTIVFYLLAPGGGGSTVEHEGFDCTVLTPEAALYQSLLGAQPGDLLDGTSLVVLEVS